LLAVANPGVPTPLALRVAARLRPLVRVAFRATLEGTENLPPSGAFLLVANHSAGLAIAEVASFVALYAARFGATRPIAGFVHRAAFGMWPWVFRQLGAIPSTYAAAEAALAAGVPILVFPGGDHEALRPFWQAGRVDFNARVGFLRIARAAGVPIVPMGIRGSHFTAPPLVRSRFFAYLFIWPRAVAGGKRWGISLLGAIGAGLILALVPVAWPWRALLAWAWTASPLSMLPWLPWKIRMRIGVPIAPQALFGDGGDDALPRALTAVESAVRELMEAKRPA
jgi:1-acyl-sn-glycerol-3-phosphate acyltransferase